MNGVYGAVCDLGWDQLDAQVFCREQFGDEYSKYLLLKKLSQ